MSPLAEIDLAGQLLISMPGLDDPNFDFSVAIVCTHSAEGAMGLVINRPAKGLVFADVAGPMGIDGDGGGMAVHLGGPVEPGRGFVLHSADWADDDTLEVAPGLRLSATKSVLCAIAADPAPSRRILALGYAGWGPGQLDAEIRRNFWLLAPAAPRLIFDLPDDEKWAASLNSLGVDPSILTGAAGRA